MQRQKQEVVQKQKEINSAKQKIEQMFVNHNNNQTNYYKYIISICQKILLQIGSSSLTL